jgi:hypothetical protein
MRGLLDKNCHLRLPKTVGAQGSTPLGHESVFAGSEALKTAA